jgi:hypothetical protein
MEGRKEPDEELESRSGFHMGKRTDINKNLNNNHEVQRLGEVIARRREEGIPG